MVNVVQADQSKIVTEITKRQDEALDQIDLLNDRIEQAIKEIVGSREAENLAAEDNQESDSEPLTVAA